MRKQVPAKDIVPGDRIWFAGNRKPTTVEEVHIQEGAEKLVVLHSNTAIWYMKYESATVFKYEPDPVIEETMEEQYLDPEGNPT